MYVCMYIVCIYVYGSIHVSIYMYIMLYALDAICSTISKYIQHYAPIPIHESRMNSNICAVMTESHAQRAIA